MLVSRGDNYVEMVIPVRRGLGHTFGFVSVITSAQWKLP